MMSWADHDNEAVMLQLAKPAHDVAACAVLPKLFLGITCGHVNGTRVTELQQEQLAIHQQATAAAAANKQVTIESLIAEAEAARVKAMSEKGGAAAAVNALTAKAKLAGMWREKVDQHNTGSPLYERIERVIVERAPQSAPGNIPDESIYDEPSTEVVREMPGRHWSAD